MSRSYLNRNGFSLIELLVVVSIIGILAAVTLVTINTSRDRSENVSIIRQVREYATAMELMYVPNGNSYVYNGSSNLNQYGCLVDTTGSAECNYNGISTPVYPDSAGIAILGTFIALQPLEVQVVDSDGHVFDSITYSTDGNSFRLRYPLKGENEDCGFDNATVIGTGGANFGGVTICRFDSE